MKKGEVSFQQIVLKQLDIHIQNDKEFGLISQTIHKIEQKLIINLQHDPKKRKTDKLDFLKIKNFCASKGNIKKKKKGKDK